MIISLRSSGLRYLRNKIRFWMHSCLTWFFSSSRTWRNNPFMYDIYRASFYFSIIKGKVYLSILSHSLSIESRFFPISFIVWSALTLIFRSKYLILTDKYVIVSFSISEEQRNEFSIWGSWLMIKSSKDWFLSTIFLLTTFSTKTWAMRMYLWWESNSDKKI